MNQKENMPFTALRAAIVARLKEAMPKEVDVAAHAGSIDIAELQRLCARPPALRVAVLKVLGVNRARGATAAELRLGVYLVTAPGKRGASASADEMALALLPRVLAAIDGENWNLPDVETRPEALDAEPLFSGSLGSALVSLWGVSWRQRVLLPPLIAFTDPDRWSNDPGELPYPWNDPLAEFLRAELELEDESGGTYADDLFSVRTGKPANKEPVE